MLDPAPDLRRALAVHATDRHLAFVLHHCAAALRAMLRHSEFFLAPRPQIGANADDRGNHFARFFDQHGVADPDVLPLDLFFVVQRRPAHRAAADYDRLECGDRRQRSGAPDLNQDVEQLRFNSLRLVFERDRPARRFCGKPEHFALPE